MPGLGPVASAPIASVGAPPACEIVSTCPWVSQELEVSSPVVVTLPDATSEPCPGTSWKLGPFVVSDAAWLIVMASNGQTIRLGPSVSAADGALFSTTVGDMVELWAVPALGEWYGWDSPEGSWTVT